MESSSAAVDAHAHVFVRGLRTAARPRYVPDYDATPEAYLSLLDEHGIAGAVLVQPSFLGYANDFVLRCLRRHPGRFRAVVVPAQDDRAVLAVTGVAGVRVNLVGRGTPDLDARAWQDLAAELASRGQHLEIQAHGEQWRALAPALHRWPSDVVIDHLGLPGRSSDADRTVLELARREHVWIKASAPYRSPGEAAARMLDRVIAEAGPDRLLWGSDWPWTQHEGGREYIDCLGWFRERVGDQIVEKVLIRNPRTLLQWSPRPVGPRVTSP